MRAGPTFGFGLHAEQAENRLHVQNALMTALVGAGACEARTAAAL